MRSYFIILFATVFVSCGRSNRSSTDQINRSSEIDSPVVRPHVDFQNLGVYLWPSWTMEAKRDYDFWKACGYNTISFLIAGVEASEASLAAYQLRIKNAQKAGFKVEIVIFSNMGPTGQGFDPRDTSQMTKRLKDIELIVTRLSFSEIITFFAGDPGGSPVALGEAGVDYFLEMGLKVRGIVKQKAPGALFNVNVWAIAHWDNINVSPFTVDFWDKETEYSKKLLADPKWAADMGIVFPMHNYYRSLALNEYAKVKRSPELFPNQRDIDGLNNKGIERRWAWPYFLIDEVDDGYTGYLLGSHPTQSETRYIYDIIRKSRSLKLNGFIINTSIDSAGIQTEALNVYATGRFCQDSTLTAEQVIDEFAALIADEKSAPILGRILRFVENHSTWEASLPEAYRIQKFDNSYPNAQAALDDLATVRRNLKPNFPLPIASSEFLNRVRSRLVNIL